MSLNAPLAVRVGTRHITTAVTGLSFREEAHGGISSITLQLARKLDTLDADLAGFSRVYIYDTRTAETVAEGRIADTGRAAGSDGETWEVAAFGPSVAASDQRFPYIVVDTRLDVFRRSSLATRNATETSSENATDVPSIEIMAEEGKTIATSWVGNVINRAVREAGQKLAQVRVAWDAGITDANYDLSLVTYTGSAAATFAATASANVAGGIMTGQVVTNFANGQDVVAFQVDRNTAAATGAETHWFEFFGVVVQPLRLTKAGVEITAGASYATNTVTADRVVEDLLGRVLGEQFDGANATVAAGSYLIDHMAYPDGVTAAEVLDDLMTLEPGFRWTTGPSNSTGKYVFSWEALPTTVRYELTLDGGGAFPASSQELYNKVIVRYKNARGFTRTTTVTGTSPALTAAGITRSTIIDAADEIGSSAGAARIGANFLTEHAYPANAGTLVVNRPVKDLVTGAMVLPHEIRAGYLCRVRGIESYPDSLNASSNDGLTVFRIWSKTYNSESDSATLELDTYSRTVANALAGLSRRRTRKR